MRACLRREQVGVIRQRLREEQPPADNRLSGRRKAGAPAFAFRMCDSVGKTPRRGCRFGWVYFGLSAAVCAPERKNEKSLRMTYVMRRPFLCKTLFPPLADACASSGKVKRFGQPQRLVGMKSRSSLLADGGPRYTDDMETSSSVKPAALQPALAFFLLRSLAVEPDCADLKRVVKALFLARLMTFSLKPRSSSVR